MTWPVDPARYFAFLGAMAVISVAPGPANVFAVATGMAQGRRAALLGVAGMNAATAILFCASVLGLGALMTALPTLFRWLAIAGGLYVAWLGLSAIRTAFSKTPPSANTLAVRQGRSAFADGFAVQIANPKILLFFTAVLPPFLDVRRPAWPQMVMFAAATLAMDALSMSAYGLGGAALSKQMDEPRFARGFSIFIGVLLILAAALILSRIER